MELDHGREKGKQPMILHKGIENETSDAMDFLSPPIICDICNNPTEIDAVCFDLAGCRHLPCYACLTLHAVTDGVKCPVSSCLNGFLYQYQDPIPQRREEPENKEKDKKGEKLTSEELRGKSFGGGHVFCMGCMASHVRAKVEDDVCPNPGCHGKEGRKGEFFFCSICMEEKLTSEAFKGKGFTCGHVFCMGCMKGHVRAEVEDGACPNPGCHGQEGKNGEFFFCSICMEEKMTSEVFKGKSFRCGHVFCMGCMAGHVHAKVEESVYPIGCPNPGCHGKVEIEDCSGILKGEVLERWGVSLLEMGFPEGVKFYCPYNDCSALLVNEGDEQGRPLMECECLHCNRLLCAQCRVPWHSGKTCEGYRREKEERREEGESSKFVEFARSKKWQKCPKCGIFVERTEGCLYIRCRCGHGFCYSCGSPMGDDHYCKVCNKSWD